VPPGLVWTLFDTLNSVSASARQEQAVLDRVDELSGEMLQFLRELVAIPTVNPPGDNYAACAEWLGERLAGFGYDVQYVPAEGRPEHTAKHPRVNVIGRLRGTPARPLLHFNGHFDVVPVGNGWTVDPFRAPLSDGKIFGRGTTDQKAGIAASIFAIEAIRRVGVRLGGAVEQSGTVDEESGGFAGMAYLAEHGLVARGRTDFVIITEPLNVDRVCLGHRGAYWFEVATIGRIAHGSMPFLGVSAISKMADFLSIIEQELKPALRLRITSMPVEPPEARQASINVNSISGGQPGGLQTPCVADRCEAIFDRRFLMEEPIEEVRSEIRDILGRLSRSDPEFQYEMKDLMTVPPILTNPDCTLVTAMSGAVRDVVGSDPPLIASPGTYDQKHVMRLGMVEQCIAYGPGILDLSHQPDEYCRVDHLVQASKAMALAALRLLGTE
jgi:succinyl-diaminopimelate desuccinylase